MYEGVEGSDEGGGGADGVGDGAAPHGALRVGFEVETGDDAEVVAAAAKGEEEGWVGGAVDVCYGGIGEDELRGFSNVWLERRVSGSCWGAGKVNWGKGT